MPDLEKNENLFELSDEADRASVIESQFQEDALAQARRKVAPEVHPDFDGEHCVACAEPIPAPRLQLGKVRCMDCQTALERRTRFYGQ